jgi:hypothetical protein
MPHQAQNVFEIRYYFAKDPLDPKLASGVGAGSDMRNN